MKSKALKYLNISGFTLIESLISIALLAVISTIAINIFSSAVQSYNKANILNELQQNGNYVITLMEQKIRNAEEIINYETIGACSIPSADCSGNTWVVIKTKNPGPTDPECIEFGLASPNPGVKNPYIYMAEPTLSSQCVFPSRPSEAAGVDKQELTNANYADPKSGVNITSLEFVIDTVKDPPLVEILISLSQGEGTSSRPQYHADINLKTTVSLRSYE